MKFITRLDRIEGDSHKWGSVLTYGRSILSNGKKDGWYVQIEVPFTIDKNFVDPMDYYVKRKPCRKIIHWHLRAPALPDAPALIRPFLRRVIHVCVWAPVK